MSNVTKNRFAIAKNIFIEGYSFDYINLDKSIVAYNKLANSLSKPLKLILFFGKPGTGKTFLLQKLYNDLKTKQPIVFLPQPFFDEKAFLSNLYREIFAKDIPSPCGYEGFLKIYKQSIPKNLSNTVVTVLLDEAQLYPNDLVEKIRLMADSRLFKFLFTVHKTDKEDVLAKDYFKTRIWETIELEDSTLPEIQSYIEKKLLFHNKFELFTIFKDLFKNIFQVTNGNLRTVNKLSYKLFELYEYLENEKPSVLSQKNINKKLFEMAAIDTGLINA